MKLNVATPPVRIETHEGGQAVNIRAEQMLRRSVMSHMLWEGEFYEDGQEIAARIAELVGKVRSEKIEAIAIEARSKMKLRHVPLYLCRELARAGKLHAETLAQVIQRADELAEFLAIYWKDKRQPLSNQVKRGLALAFRKFDEYSLAKYNADGPIKLRDVLFLCHARPKDDAQAALWKRLISGALVTPDTWEVELSKGGSDKKASWERLLAEKRLFALALLRNLRNMTDAAVPVDSIRSAIREMKTERVLPFRFIAAARYAMNLEPELEAAMFRCLEGAERLPGSTVLLIDVSGSMEGRLSSKSDMTRMDAACGLAMLLREITDCRVFTFSTTFVEVPPRRGFALRDAIVRSQPHAATYFGTAVQQAPKAHRLIAITDEQSHDQVIARPDFAHSYCLNVASNRNGVGYGPWTHIDGFSEACVDFIREYESRSCED